MNWTVEELAVQTTKALQLEIVLDAFNLYAFVTSCDFKYQASLQLVL